MRGLAHDVQKNQASRYKLSPLSEKEWGGVLAIRDKKRRGLLDSYILFR